MLHAWRLACLLSVTALSSCSSDPGASTDGLGGSSGQGPDASTGGAGGTGGACAAQTCAQLGATCGTAPDGCGSVVTCGTCPTGSLCGGGGPNTCGTTPCSPRSCAQAGASCGYASDGCGSVNQCGTCPAGVECKVQSGSQACKQGTGGTGGSAGGCNASDPCQDHGWNSDWHCDASRLVRCSTQGVCSMVAETKDCAPQGCSNGACGSACVAPCQGHCGPYNGCDCGSCAVDYACVAAVCQLDCSSVCLNSCGTLQGCTCDACPAPELCVDNACVECKEGQTDSQACQPADNCPMGTQKRTCTAGSWDMFDDCVDGAASVRYHGDGAVHCGTGGGADVLCVQLAAAGGNTTVKATVSRFDNAIFSDNIDLVLQDVGGFSQQPFGCVAAKGHKTVSVTLDPSVFGMVLGDTLSIEADATSPCSGGDAWYSDSGTISQCKL